MLKIDYDKTEEIRNRHGMTRDAFCQAIGVKPQTYYCWKHYNRKPCTEIAQRIREFDREPVHPMLQDARG